MGSWRSVLRAALIRVAPSLILEAGHVVLTQRTAELTDALSASVGTGLGLSLWKWGESVRDPTDSLRVTRYRVDTQGKAIGDGLFGCRCYLVAMDVIERSSL
jgi:hypothetical protein